MSSNTSLSVSTSGVAFNRFDSYTGYLRQVLANTSIKGKTVTVSLLLQNNTLLSDTVTFPTSGSVSLQFTSALNVDLSVSGSDCYFDVLAVAGATVSLRAVKLEVGSVSTLANDVAPNYTTELLKCQRYFYKLTNAVQISISFASSTDVASVIFNLPVP